LITDKRYNVLRQYRRYRQCHGDDGSDLPECTLHTKLTLMITWEHSASRAYTLRKDRTGV